MAKKDHAEKRASAETAEPESGENEVEEQEIKEAPATEETTTQEAAPEQDEVEVLRDELSQIQAKADEYLDGWQRTQAEFSNYKKRQESDRSQLWTRITMDVLRKLLPVVDDFERAVATMPADLHRLTWCEGVLLIRHKLAAILESEGVQPIDVEGEMFDPLYHEAVTYEEAAGFEEGQIIGEVQRGYTIRDQVLRPALVRVAKAPSPQDEKAAETEASDNATENKE